jgi:hypothetical protein
MNSSTAADDVEHYRPGRSSARLNSKRRNVHLSRISPMHKKTRPRTPQEVGVTATRPRARHDRGDPSRKGHFRVRSTAARGIEIPENEPGREDDRGGDRDQKYVTHAVTMIGILSSGHQRSFRSGAAIASALAFARARARAGSPLPGTDRKPRVRGEPKGTDGSRDNSAGDALHRRP